VRVALALALVAAAAVAAPAAVRADSATSSEVRSLAARAAQDPDALERLRRIDVVDGRPVDLARAIGGAEGDELRARLEALAGGDQAAVSGDPGADARRILDGRRFHESSVPRPFHGLLAWLGDRLRGLADKFGWLDDVVPGGPSVLWTMLGIVVVVIAAFVARRVGLRRAGIVGELAQRSRRRSAVDPARLEREAEEAERQGDLERALRLRFRAGLLRLGRAKAIPLRESVTTREVRRALRLEEFDELALGFDEVVYGGRPARAGDLATAKQAWPRVLERMGAR
jgi:hypothetical protein